MKKIAISFLFLMMPIFAFAQSATTSNEIDLLVSQIQQEVFNADLLKEIIDPNTNLPVGYSDAISTKVSSRTPRPFEKVTITVDSNTVNLDRATFTWTLDGKQIIKGVGEKEFSFVTKKLGVNSKVSLVVDKIEGGKFEQSYTFTPVEVDLFYEAQTTSMPFFLGKPQFTFQSAVRIIANPRGYDRNGVLIPAEDYVYSWSINDRVFQDKSGYGKNFLIYRDSIFSEKAKITVSVSSRDGYVKGSGQITIEPESPVVRLYENNPIYGFIFNNSLASEKELARDEVNIVAFPISFDNNSNLSFNWSMNGEIIDSNKTGSITFRKQEGVAGTSQIYVEVNNRDKILQGASGFLDLVFNSKKTND